MSRFYVTKITRESAYDSDDFAVVELSAAKAKSLLGHDGSKLIIGPMPADQAATFKIGAPYEVEVREAELSHD